ncbi:Ribonucleases P/MRP protein subunit POP1 [Hypsibius exemplaris]|uniref:Ribonucleases P/MRP protein subunit POP1 n=1 Tax=Hypsibius exemplaris TaxID=2072580 RepID=A0A1W0WYP0_HYPEX|nr:Ribonucleases P/MRP protein subunit POP1 [Hypsibius exemplaris]
MNTPSGKKRRRSAASPAGGERPTDLPAGVSRPAIPAGVPKSFSQMDSSQAGLSVSMPRDVNVIAFAEKRSREIRTLMESLSGKRTNKRIFQQLPRHMRRRAMSYNVKRLPKRLRAAADVEISRAKKPKRPKNKYRKRGRNKKLLFARRQQSKCWLETHVWHAKRFHMVERWGYKVANHANDKGHRAAFRASSEHCLMSDVSYLNCWEFKGPQTDLLAGLQKFTSPETGRTFAYKDFLDGHLEGSCMLYEPNMYPAGSIGVVRFTWVQTALPSSNPTTNRSLHIWTHPSVSDTFLTHVVTVFGMDPVDSDKNSTTPIPDLDAMEVDEGNADDGGLLKSMSAVGEEKGIPEGTVKVQGKTELRAREYRSVTCSLRLLKKDLIRFRLTGPKSTAVLKSVMKPVTFPTEAVEGDFWWKPFLVDGGQTSAMELQHATWTGMDAVPLSSDVRAGSVLGLVVRDPRIFLPRRKISLADAENQNASSGTIGSSSRLPNRSAPLAASVLWSEGVRDQVKRDKMSDRDMNKLRSALPAPGMELDLGADEAKIPVVLIRNAGYNSQEAHSKADYGAGWDLIIPAGWAMPFWIPLVYNGARVAGLQEMATVARHRAALLGPADLPDSAAGNAIAMSRRHDLEGKFQRYPPDKRPNFIKMGTLSPFHSPWPALTQDWLDIAKFTDKSPALLESAPADFHVIRNLRLLTVIQNLFSGSITTEKLVADHSVLLQTHSRGIVAVHVLFHAGGSAEDFSMLAMPATEDLEKAALDKHFKGPVEPPHKDPFRKTQPPKQRRKLQLDMILSDKDSVVDHCSRKLLGYVVKGGYSFIRGAETAMGFCTLLGLMQLARITAASGGGLGGATRDALPVLVRHPHSLQYHFAGMSVLPYSPCL